MPVERRGWVIAFEIGSSGNGRNPIFNGRRQRSCGGTSRMTRECQVRICERLGVKSLANSKAEIQRPGGLAPPAPAPDGSLGLPDPLGTGFLGAALAPFFFVVVAWPVVSIRCVPPTPWVVLDAVPPPAIGPDWAVALPDCWAFATMTPPTSAAVASRLASIFIETSRDVPRNYRGARMPPSDLQVGKRPYHAGNVSRQPPAAPASATGHAVRHDRHDIIRTLRSERLADANRGADDPAR